MDRSCHSGPPRASLWRHTAVSEVSCELRDLFNKRQNRTSEIRTDIMKRNTCEHASHGSYLDNQQSAIIRHSIRCTHRSQDAEGRKFLVADSCESRACQKKYSSQEPSSARMRGRMGIESNSLPPSLWYFASSHRRLSSLHGR